MASSVILHPAACTLPAAGCGAAVSQMLPPGALGVGQQVAAVGWAPALGVPGLGPGVVGWPQPHVGQVLLGQYPVGQYPLALGWPGVAPTPAPSAWYLEAAPAGSSAARPGPPSPPHVDEVAELKAQMGIQPSEDECFGWIAEYGMRSDALPSRWTSHTDPATGGTYYVDAEAQESSWENPLLSSLLRALEAGRLYLQRPSEDFFEEQRILLWHEHKEDLESWHGPLEDGDRAPYFVNSATGQSSRSDPREDAQYTYEVESVLLKGLEQVLRRPGERTPDAGDSLMDSFSRKRDQAQQSASEDHQCALKRMGSAADWLRATCEEEVEAQRLQFSRKLRERQSRRTIGPAAPAPAAPAAGLRRSRSAASSTSSLRILEEAGMDFKLLPLDGGLQHADEPQAKPRLCRRA